MTGLVNIQESKFSDWVVNRRLDSLSRAVVQAEHMVDSSEWGEYFFSFFSFLLVVAHSLAVRWLSVAGSLLVRWLAVSLMS